MNSATANDPPLPLNIRGARVSTVVVQRVPADRAERFLECQRGLSQAAEGFPGYGGTELYPPADDGRDEWVAVIHFDETESLRRWIDSPERDLWAKKLRDEVGEFQLKTLPAGFGAWFAGLVAGPEGKPPPSWKMALTVLLGLYPTVMLLALLFGSGLRPLGLAVSMLISNALSVSLCQWVVLPPLTRALGPWLHANTPDRRALSVGGLALVCALLIGLALLFRTVAG
jgi:uncharacterized protein